ncbi:2'-5' RNA ligase family protein [Phenylobacterium montanum]|uniref:2'-5' RNA ligase family protein n=1 Tax=Phenylobacterium montanum TaxID=2823693 RepID=UPI0020110484|nr:2'-5' RNA ligase family protein [Caulobacter sp. S6]
MPDSAGVEQIGDAARRLRAENRLRGRALEAGRFHITLHHVDDYVGLPADVVEKMSRAAETVTAAPFEVEFDYAASFSGRPGNRPFVLGGGEGLKALIAFRNNLADAIRRTGVGRKPSAQFVPHVTLLYDQLVIQQRPVEPIRWTVRELVLVHSLLGRTQHLPLARWPLKG